MKPLYLALSGGGAHAAAHAGVLRRARPRGGARGRRRGRERGSPGGGGLGGRRRPRTASCTRPLASIPGCGCGAGAAGFCPGRKLGALIDEFLPIPTFEGLRVPVSVLATDVDTGEAVVFREGNLRDAVRASCSFPGVFPPMVLGGRRLYDGGITEVIPVRLAREMAGETGIVVAVDANSGTKWPGADSFVAIALRAGLTLLRGRSRGELAGADLVIAPGDGGVGVDAPGQDPGFYTAGHDALVEALPELRRLIKE